MAVMIFVVVVEVLVLVVSSTAQFAGMGKSSSAIPAVLVEQAVVAAVVAVVVMRVCWIQALLVDDNDSPVSNVGNRSSGSSWTCFGGWNAQTNDGKIRNTIIQVDPSEMHKQRCRVMVKYQKS